MPAPSSEQAGSTADDAAVRAAADRRAQGLWRQTLRVTALLLGLWLLLNLLAPWFARELNTWQFAGFPLGWWIAAQGALVVYLAIAWGYVWWMDRLEARWLAQQSSQASELAAPDAPAEPK